MSKQYLTAHTLDALHPADIFTLATTPTSIFSGSGSASIRINSTRTSTFPLTQTLEQAHPLGCHHISAALCGTHAVSVGFDGTVKIWANETLLNADPAGGLPDADDHWVEEKGEPLQDQSKAGEIWAIALSAEARYLAATAADGRISVWDLTNPSARVKIQSWETKGSFGQCVDISTPASTARGQDGARELVASGHASGAIYVFSLSSGRMVHSLPGLASPVRTVRFSPASTLLAAAGDARVIALYSVQSGEQVASLASGTGLSSSSWIFSVSWSPGTGEYLVSAGWDGKIRVWRTETGECVATMQEAEKAVWSVEWLKGNGGQKGVQGRVEGFAAAGTGGGIRFYREAAGS